MGFLRGLYERLSVFKPDGADAVDRGQAIRFRELPDGESGARAIGLTNHEIAVNMGLLWPFP